MSVKTGAVGSNPKIDKLMNVDLASLERFASTTMLSQILQTDTLESGNDNSDVTVAETAAESRKAIKENREKMSQQELPKEGIYVKDLEKGNVVARYKKAASERELQMQAACTLAFTEEEAMNRNGITEEERGEFFTSYLELESEYLVEGAMLTCTKATEEMIIWPNCFTGELSKTENALAQVENPANDGEKKYATVSDSIRGKNIGIFKNCSASSSPESTAKVNQSVKECKTYGTCYALMDLCEEWVNVADGAVYGKAEGDLKNCINMLSHLGCYQGGIIFPLNTGQGESEEDIIEEIVNVKEEILRLLEEEGIQSVDAYIQKLKTDNPGVDKFLELLGMRENSGSYSNHPTDRKHNYYGLYQIGKKTFKQIDFMDDTGKWTDLAKSFGVNSFDSYLKNPTAQDVAIIFALRWDYQYILSNGDDVHYDTQIEGVDITQSGIVAAYHLVGHRDTHDAFIGKEKWEDTDDGNEVPALTYMAEMGGLDLSILFGGIE